MGRYELLHRLAVGGMAELYLARQSGIEGFEKVVVLKRVLPHLSEDPEFVSMFLSEARMAAALDHPNIAAVTDIGEEAGEYFFAMEYVHGRNLLEVLKRGAEYPLSMACALTVIAGVAAALHHAHELLGPDGRPLGLVHRDVSPSNVMIAHSGAVKLTDFGIAKAVSRTSTTLEGKIKGKVGYMSPEQTRGDMIDRRSDIFALGILLYEATTGARAFYATNDFAAMGRIARADFVQPTQIQPDFPVELEMIIGRALQKEPGARYSTAEQLQLELEEFAHANGVRLSALELARHMKRAFGSPAHPQTDLQSFAGAPVVAPQSRDKEAPPAPRRAAWLPWAVAGTAAAIVSTLTITMWPPAAEQPAITETEPAPAPEPQPQAQAQPRAHAQAQEDAEPPAPSAAPPADVAAASPPEPEPEPVDPPTKKKKKKRKKRRDKTSGVDRDALYPKGLKD